MANERLSGIFSARAEHVTLSLLPFRQSALLAVSMISYVCTIYNRGKWFPDEEHDSLNTLRERPHTAQQYSWFEGLLYQPCQP